MSEKKQQTTPNINSQNELWDEYLKEREDEKDKKEPVQAQISLQVEQDLLEFSRTNQAKSSRKNKKPLLIAGVLVAITFSLLTIITAVRYDSYDYDEIIDEIEDVEEGEYKYVGDNLSVPEFMFDGEYYKLPIDVKEFLDNDLEIKTGAFEEETKEVGSEPKKVTFVSEDGYEEIDALVASPSEEIVNIEDAVIVGVSVDKTVYNITLPHYISYYEDEDAIEEALNESGVDWTMTSTSGNSQYSFSENLEDSPFSTYNFQLTLNDDEIQQITMVLEK